MAGGCAAVRCRCAGRKEKAGVADNETVRDQWPRPPAATQRASAAREPTRRRHPTRTRLSCSVALTLSSVSFVVCRCGQLLVDCAGETAAPDSAETRQTKKRASNERRSVRAHTATSRREASASGQTSVVCVCAWSVVPSRVDASALAVGARSSAADRSLQQAPRRSTGRPGETSRPAANRRPRETRGRALTRGVVGARTGWKS